MKRIQAGSRKKGNVFSFLRGIEVWASKGRLRGRRWPWRAAWPPVMVRRLSGMIRQKILADDEADDDEAAAGDERAEQGGIWGCCV